MTFVFYSNLQFNASRILIFTFNLSFTRGICGLFSELNTKSKWCSWRYYALQPYLYNQLSWQQHMGLDSLAFTCKLWGGTSKAGQKDASSYQCTTVALVLYSLCNIVCFYCVLINCVSGFMFSSVSFMWSCVNWNVIFKGELWW